MPVYTSSIEVTADYPTIKPSLNLNFARSRALDPRITFTRASVGTYVGRDGLIKTAGEDEPRFDHDPDTLESLGLLIEESRTNLVTYSEDFSNWTSFNTTITNNVAVAPDGTTTADLLTENSTVSGTQHGMVINHPKSTTNYIISAFFKEPPTNSKRYVTLTLHGMGYVAFDIQTGTIAQSYGSGIVDNGIYPVGDGWYRCWVNYLNSNTTQGTYIILHDGSNTGHVYAGDGVSGMYVWGAQCEEATFPTSYIPTSGSSVTRAGDFGVINGTSFTNIFNYNEGTFSAKVRINGYNPTGYPRPFMFALQSNPGADFWQLVFNNSGQNFFTETRENTGTPRSNSAVSVAAGVDVIVTSAVKNGEGLTSYYGGSIRTNSVGSISPSIDSLTFNQYNYNGTISNLSYYPQRLTDAQLQLLTS